MCYSTYFTGDTLAQLPWRSWSIQVQMEIDLAELWPRPSVSVLLCCSSHLHLPCCHAIIQPADRPCLQCSPTTPTLDFFYQHQLQQAWQSHISLSSSVEFTERKTIQSNQNSSAWSLNCCHDNTNKQILSSFTWDNCPSFGATAAPMVIGGWRMKRNKGRQKV